MNILLYILPIIDYMLSYSCLSLSLSLFFQLTFRCTSVPFLRDALGLTQVMARKLTYGNLPALMALRFARPFAEGGMQGALSLCTLVVPLAPHLLQ